MQFTFRQVDTQREPFLLGVVAGEDVVEFEREVLPSVEIIEIGDAGILHKQVVERDTSVD